MARKKKTKKKKEWSKLLTLLVILAGIGITQECFGLMYLCISRGYTATAGWLTAAVGLAQVVIATGLNAYLSLCKVDHAEGGLTHAIAKSNGFTVQDNPDDAPPI